MAQAVGVDRKATRSEVIAHADDLRRVAARQGFVDVHIRSDGALIVHDETAGYRLLNRLASSASELVGAYVPVITDNVPGAEADAPAL
jgi:hypothetical protein